MRMYYDKGSKNERAYHWLIVMGAIKGKNGSQEIDPKEIFGKLVECNSYLLEDSRIVNHNGIHFTSFIND